MKIPVKDTLSTAETHLNVIKVSWCLEHFISQN